MEVMKWMKREIFKTYQYFLPASTLVDLPLVFLKHSVHLDYNYQVCKETVIYVCLVSVSMLSLLKGGADNCFTHDCKQIKQNPTTTLITVTLIGKVLFNSLQYSLQIKHSFSGTRNHLQWRVPIYCYSVLFRCIVLSRAPEFLYLAWFTTNTLWHRRGACLG